MKVLYPPLVSFSCDMPLLGHVYSMQKKKICFIFLPGDIAMEKIKWRNHWLSLSNAVQGWKVILFVILKCVWLLRKSNPFEIIEGGLSSRLSISSSVHRSMHWSFLTPWGLLVHWKCHFSVLNTLGENCSMYHLLSSALFPS